MNEHEFMCPYCAQTNWLTLDLDGGREQQFVTDCEVCCRPIVITAHLDGDGSASLQAVAELLD